MFLLTQHMRMRYRPYLVSINWSLSLSVCVCQVVLENYGDIEASYTVQPSTSLFGPKFSFTPSTGTIQPDGLQAIQVIGSSYDCNALCLF